MIILKDDATDPNFSIWVNASAGSGKTTLLVERIVRLILNKQVNILCLAFTNNAVDEIKSRIIARLSALAEQDSHIASMMDDLDNILNICTIHSFCQGILQHYSAEFSLFKLNDEIQKKFYSYAIRDYLDEDCVMTNTSKELTLWHLEKIVHKLFPIYGSILGDANKTIYLKDELKKLIQNYDYITKIDENVIKTLEGGEGKKEQLLASKLRRKDFVNAFVGAKGELKNLKQLITNKILEGNERIMEHLFKVQAEYFEHYNIQLFNQMITDTTHLLDVLHIIYMRYISYKGNYITYNELIFKALELLNSSEWVLYELSHRIDHILVDEAQDNNSNYWQIIYTISEDFFVGSSDREMVKTLFVVGDLKQAIYGFQNSSPEIFQNMREFILSKSSKGTWKIVNLDLCYRCTTNILQFVDSIFSVMSHDSLFKDYVNHIPHRKESGKVERWDIVETSQELALKIAQQINSWISDEYVIESLGRAIKKDDIAILIRHRTNFIGYIVKELNYLGIETNCAEVIDGSNELIKLLLNIARVALWEDDEHSMYELLLSPIFNLKEEEIFDIAHDRCGTLYGALYNKAPYIYHSIKAWKDNISTPLCFYIYVLYGKLIFDKITTYFGLNSQFIIDIFLKKAQQYFSLADFINDFECGVIVLKEALSSTGVTISTIHKAKGMEFPVVILADTTTVPIADDCGIIFTEHGLPLWITKSNAKQILKLKEEKRRIIYSEYLRLLYVALTRAKDELIIVGHGKQATKGSWYELLTMNI